MRRRRLPAAPAQDPRRRALRAPARRGRSGTSLLALAGVLLLGSCNSPPVDSLDDKVRQSVRHVTGTGQAVKIDFLWVVDNSSSMCEEQLSLAENFDQFTEVLGGQLELDPRVAVTTMDMHCDPSNPNVEASKGRFNTLPAQGFPPGCQEKRIRPCQEDADCAGLDQELPGSWSDPNGEDTGWTCRGVQLDRCIQNPNGSFNTGCKRTCAEPGLSEEERDEKCQELFDDSRYECQAPSGSPEDSGCILPPLTSGCPSRAGPVLLQQDGTNDPPVREANSLENFQCAATVGVNQLKCFRYEQGMKAALAALDPEGPNAGSLNCASDGEGCRQFLREDAYLVMIFVSDEDDCSADPSVDCYPNDDERNDPICEGNRETCALLDTTDEGGPLIPVGHYVNRFKSLKSDPSRVIVASIAGDAVDGDGVPPDNVPPDDVDQPPDEFDPAHSNALGCGDNRETCEGHPTFSDGDLPAEREAYVQSKGDDFDCHQTSYICASQSGRADWGRRYRRLTQSFGPNGIFTNICSPEGIRPALEAIANQIVTIVDKICLPRRVKDPASLTVKVRPPNGEVRTLDRSADGSPGTYQLLSPNQAGRTCEQDGERLPAIQFGKPPAREDEVIVTYEGDPLVTR